MFNSSDALLSEEKALLFSLSSSFLAYHHPYQKLLADSQKVTQGRKGTVRFFGHLCSAEPHRSPSTSKASIRSNVGVCQFPLNSNIPCWK